MGFLKSVKLLPYLRSDFKQGTYIHFLKIKSNVSEKWWKTYYRRQIFSSVTLTYALTVLTKSVSDDMAVIWVGAASWWRETSRGTWDKKE